MEHILLLSSVSVFLFQIVQSENSPLDALVSSDLSLSKYYEKSAKDFLSDRLVGTQFCESILLPTGHNLRKLLQATLFSGRNDTYLDDKGRLDSCCRSLHKCDAYKNIELNNTNDINILHCECVYSLRVCLQKINTSLSSDLALIHSINTTKCYAKGHPIVKCVKLEVSLGSSRQNTRFLGLKLNDTFFKRCIKYEFDESQPQKLQLFDLPFIDPGKSTIAALSSEEIDFEQLIESEARYDNEGRQTKGSPLQTIVTKINKAPLHLRVVTALLSLVEDFGCEFLQEIQTMNNATDDKLVNKTLSFGIQIIKYVCDHKVHIESSMTTKDNSKYSFYSNITMFNFTINQHN